MSRLFRCASPMVLTLALSPSWALAELTAADVWNDWKSYMSSFGYTMDGNESLNGGVLTVTEVAMTLPMAPEAEMGDARIEIPEMVFTENADGTVNVTLPPVMQMTVKGQPEGGEPVDMALAYEQSGFDMVVAGAPNDLTYTYAADEFRISFDRLNVDGADLIASAGNFEVVMTGVDGVSTMKVGELRDYSQTVNANEMSFVFDFKDPEGSDGSFKMNGGLQGLIFTGGGLLPLQGNAADMSALLSSGVVFEGGFEFATGANEIAFDGPEGAGAVNTSSDGGTVQIGMSSDGLFYDVTQRGSIVSMVLPDVPLPISYSTGETRGLISMPIQKSDDEQDFRVLLNLDDFEMADALWGLFDATGQLPRDPADLVVDLNGKAKLLFDLFDPEQAAALEQSGAVPGELNSLTVNQLLLDIVGARLTGDGAFTFDNADLATFGGVPRPEGSLNLQLVGGNGLIDKLVGMGLLPEEQASGARMMLGLFAVPGEGEDTLTSTLEINDQGHVLANGQRIQ